MYRHRCDPNRLRLLLDDELQDQQQAEMENHLSDCVDCQQTLERLAADKRWWDELPQLNVAAEVNPSALYQLSGRSRAPRMCPRFPPAEMVPSSRD